MLVITPLTDWSLGLSGHACDEGALEAAGLSAEELTIELVDFNEGTLPDSDVVADIGGAIIRLGPEGTEFPVPIALDFALPTEMVRADMPEILIATWEDARWRTLPVHVEHSDGGVVASAMVRHFSDFCIAVSSLRPQVRVSVPFTSGQPGELQMAGFGTSSHVSLAVVELDGPGQEAIEGETIDTYSPGTADEFNWPVTLPAAGSYRLKTLSDGGGAVVEGWSRKLLVDEALVIDGSLEMTELVQNFLPVFQFATEWPEGGTTAERWLPVPVDTSYFEQPVTMSETSAYEEVEDLAGVTGTAAIDALASMGTEQSLLMSRRDEDHWVSEAWSEHNEHEPGIDDITVYASAHQPGDGHLYLTYWTFYIHDSKTNGPDEHGGGAHDRDRESITVVLDDSDYTPIEVIYAGHMPGHSMWVAGESTKPWTGDALVLQWDDVDRFEDHPVGYIAAGSHAFYARAMDFVIHVASLSTFERAGGGWTYCPEGLAACTTYEGHTVANGHIDLQFLPVMSDVDGRTSTWRHLWYSGYWIDGTFWVGMEFPPFMNRYTDPSGWRAGALTDNADSSITDVLGAASIVETPADPLVEGVVSAASAAAVVMGERLEGLGRSLAPAGDMDGDGNLDLLVGACSSYNGVVYLLPGPLIGTAESSDISLAMIEGESGLDRSYVVTGNMDVDGDGNLDIAIGAPMLSGYDQWAGAAYLLFGPLSGDYELEDVGNKWNGNGSQIFFGDTLATVGDVTGDGLDNWIATAMYSDEGGSSAGAVYVLGGAAGEGEDNVSDLTVYWYGESSHDDAGIGADSAGDFNADGVPESLIGKERR